MKENELQKTHLEEKLKEKDQLIKDLHSQIEKIEKNENYEPPLIREKKTLDSLRSEILALKKINNE